MHSSPTFYFREGEQEHTIVLGQSAYYFRNGKAYEASPETGFSVDLLESIAKSFAG